MSDVQKRNQHLQDEMKQLVKDINELLDSTAVVSSTAAGSARARVEESLQKLQDQVDSGMFATGKAAMQLHRLDQCVRASPSTTMEISLGVGLLLCSPSSTPPARRL